MHPEVWSMHPEVWSMHPEVQSRVPRVADAHFSVRGDHQAAGPVPDGR